jgi:8-oxo-dGTP pyrophosphatase MutT (NUDIX family)
VPRAGWLWPHQPQTQMSKKNGPWTIHGSETKYTAPMVRVVEDRVTKPDGSEGSYTNVHIDGAVYVLPLDADGRVHLARQFRYGTGGHTLEVAAGSVEDGEDPAEAARRELREEIGLLADDWTDLGRFQLGTSMLRCPGWLYLAQRLTRTETDQDDTEDIERISMPFTEAVEMAMDGRIDHAPSVLLILKAARFLESVKGEG